MRCRGARLVVLALALTPRDPGIIGAEALAAMDDDAWMVNVARGGHVVTDDLVAALRGGTIGGAALDVTDPEPLPDGHPLWSLPNCIITPARRQHARDGRNPFCPPASPRTPAASRRAGETRLVGPRVDPTLGYWTRTRHGPPPEDGPLLWSSIGTGRSRLAFGRTRRRLTPGRVPARPHRWAGRERAGHTDTGGGVVDALPKARGGSGTIGSRSTGGSAEAGGPDGSTVGRIACSCAWPCLGLLGGRCWCSPPTVHPAPALSRGELSPSVVSAGPTGLTPATRAVRRQRRRTDGT